MDISAVITFLESNPAVAALLANLERNSDSWLDFTVASDIETYQGMQVSLRVLIPHAKKVKFSCRQEFTYPSIIYDDDCTGYVLVCLSEDEIIIAEISQEHYVVNATQAHEYLVNKEDNSGQLWISTITDQVTKNELIDKISQCYVKLIKKIATESIDDFRRVVNLSDWNNTDWRETVSDTNLVIELLHTSKKVYKTVMRELC